MTQTPMRNAIRHAAFAGFAIHTLAALWIWRDSLVGPSLLIYMSLPASLAFLGASGKSLLGLALVFGGLEWALLGGLVAWWIGRSLRRRSEEDL